MNARFRQLLAVFTLSSCFGCGSSGTASSPQPVGADVIQEYSFQVQGEPTTTSITLPQQVSGTEWEKKQDLCQQAGYDLAPYAGHDLTLTRYSLTESYDPGIVVYADLNGLVQETDLPNLSLYLWVIAKDEATVCGYVSIAEENNYVQELLESGSLHSVLLPVTSSRIEEER